MKPGIKDVLFLSLMGRTPMGERFHNDPSCISRKCGN